MHEVYLNTILAGIIAVTAFLGAMLFARSRWLHNIRTRLDFYLPDVPDHIRDRRTLTSNSSADASDISIVKPLAAISLLDTLFELHKIDSQVFSAIERSHGSALVSSYSELLKQLQVKADLGGQAWGKMIDRYKGYYGEELMAEHLRSLGCHVEMAGTPNQEGYDALVDGVKVQFKAGLSTAPITEHLAKHPDIPIVTVNEHAEHFQSDDNVFPLEISGNEIEETTSSTISEMLEQATIESEIPLVTAVLSGGKHLYRTYKGHLTIREATKFTISDVAGIGTGAMAGGIIGGIAGIPGGPLGIAAGEVLGEVLGAIIGRAASRFFKEADLRTANEIVNAALEKYPQVYATAMAEKSAILNKRASELKSKGIRWLLWPSIRLVIQNEISVKYQAWAERCQNESKKISLRVAASSDTAALNALGRDLLRRERAFSKGSARVLKDIGKGLSQIAHERRKHGYKTT